LLPGKGKFGAGALSDCVEELPMQTITTIGTTIEEERKLQTYNSALKHLEDHERSVREERIAA
jgi:hypothetical protein